MIREVQTEGQQDSVERDGGWIAFQFYKELRRLNAIAYGYFTAKSAKFAKTMLLYLYGLCNLIFH